MINIKDEFLNATKDKVIKCAEIATFRVTARLPIGYDDNAYIDFLKKIDFIYDNKSGLQKLFGNIWLTDDSWLRRSEINELEFWEYLKSPKIPDYLKS